MSGSRRSCDRRSPDKKELAMTNGGGPYHEDKKSQIKVEELTDQKRKEISEKKQAVSNSGAAEKSKAAPKADAARA